MTTGGGNSLLTALIFAGVSVTALLVVLVDGHGYLMDPPMRSTAWRYGFGTPINYDDNGLTCGGISAQFNNVNQGRCGECGDLWSAPRPRANDEGGTYGRGVIVKNYTRGALIPVKVDITASHMGYFEFRLCADKKTVGELVTQQCLDKNLLRFADGSTRFDRVVDGLAKVYNLLLQLPPDVTCQYCVLQWSWVSGNSNGLCPNGTSMFGCGPQETYANCADITIL